jgi:hypothetical protein
VSEFRKSWAAPARLSAADKGVTPQAGAAAASRGWFWRILERGYRAAARLLWEKPARAWRAPEEIELLRVALVAMKERNAALEARVEELAGRLKAHLSGARHGQPMNLTTRGQVLKMARAGRQPEQIAVALGVPRGEVELLLRLQYRPAKGGEQEREKLGEATERIPEFSR